MKTSKQMAKALGVDSFKYQLTPTVYWEVDGKKFKAQLSSDSEEDMFNEINELVVKSREINDYHRRAD